MLDELVHNGSSRGKPRRFFVCRKCGRRTRDINKHPEDAFGWTVAPSPETRCSDCNQVEETETQPGAGNPTPSEQTRTRYSLQLQDMLKKVRSR